MKVFRCFFFLAAAAWSLFLLYFAALADMPVVAERICCWFRAQALHIHCCRGLKREFRRELLH